MSHQTNRLGHHFQNRLLDSACNYLGYHRSGPLFWKDGDRVPGSRLATLMRPTNATDLEDTQQIEVAIRVLFPKIPESDLKQIAEDSFQEASLLNPRYRLASNKYLGI